MPPRKRKQVDVTADALVETEAKCVVAGVQADQEAFKKLIAFGNSLVKEATASLKAARKAQLNCTYCVKRTESNCFECDVALCGECNEKCKDYEKPFCRSEACCRRCDFYGNGCEERVCDLCWCTTTCENTGGCQKCCNENVCADCDICEGNASAPG